MASLRTALFFQWSNGNVMKVGGFELGRSSGCIQCAAQALRTQFPPPLGLIPWLLHLRGRNSCATALAAAFPWLFCAPVRIW